MKHIVKTFGSAAGYAYFVDAFQKNGGRILMINFHNGEWVVTGLEGEQVQDEAVQAKH